MELELIRTYYPEGTNGKILLKGSLIVYTIELPHHRVLVPSGAGPFNASVGDAWKDNLAQVSCIPEGRYELKKRWSPRLHRHLQVSDVPARECILIHPANDALRELKGCIAPVSLIIGQGKGIRSRIAMDALNNLVYGAMDLDDRVFLNIKTDPYESS